MSATLSLFERAPRAEIIPPPAAPLGGGDPDDLRPYQRAAVVGIREKLQSHRSTILVMATGTGKTQTFGAVAKHWPGRVLVLAHREELIQQARARMSRMTGEFVGVEQAQFEACGERIVVASVQTLCRMARLQRFKPNAFQLGIVDEAHHAIAPTYRRVIDYFADAKWLGVTATPDRADARAMEQVFESVAFTYDIHDGIRDAYLVPVLVRPVTVKSINLAAVKTTAGDLNQGQLDQVMALEENLHGVVKPTLAEAGDRRTIVFTTSVDNAHRMAEIFNRYRSGCARAVDGGTASDERRAILRAHKAGEFQVLCNVGVLTEGYDDPEIACVAMGRPTKSRALYVQMMGRGLRPAEGKSDCLVLDFAGNSGRHDLVSSLDILGGKWDDEVVEQAKKDATESDGATSTEAALAAAAAKLEAAKQAAIAARLKARADVEYTIELRDPFLALGVKRDTSDLAPVAASPQEIEALLNLGVDRRDTSALTSQQAQAWLRESRSRYLRGLASFKQIRKLSEFGFNAQRMKKATASELTDAIIKHGWKRPPREVVDAILSRGREPGEEG